MPTSPFQNVSTLGVQPAQQTDAVTMTIKMRLHDCLVLAHRIEGATTKIQEVIFGPFPKGVTTCLDNQETYENIILRLHDVLQESAFLLDEISAKV